ncbi:hypothetical protein BCO23253_00734 [Burkholderia contaminans]|nr:hypothetical protein BCO23253_00734 [Burkholderia contaminans]
MSGTSLWLKSMPVQELLNMLVVTGRRYGANAGSA